MHFRWLLIPVAVATVVGPGSALAAGPLVVNGSGTPLVWATNPVPFNPELGTLGTLTNGQAVAAVTSAFNVWAAVPTATISFTNAAALPVDVTIDNWDTYLGTCGDGLSPIVFDDFAQDLESSIIGQLFGPDAVNDVAAFGSPECESLDSTTIIEGSLVINGRFLDGSGMGQDPELTAAELTAVLVREIGHFINLDNSQINLLEAEDNPSTNDNAVASMYPFLINGTEQGTLHHDDVVSVSTLYPEPAFAGFGRITGLVLLPNGEGAFQGAFVIARKVGDPRLTAVGAASGARFFPGHSGGTPSPMLRAFYEIPGLPVGDYTVEIEAIDPMFIGDQTVGPLDPPAILPGPAEFWNGANESNANPPDSPTQSVNVSVTAGATQSGIDFIINGTVTGPVNDRCTAPKLVGATPYSDMITTTAGSTGIFDPFQSCTFGGPNQNARSVWYSFTPASNGTVTANTTGSNHDTVLSAYSGACANLTSLACNDDKVFPSILTSEITFPVTAGTTYLIEATKSFLDSSTGAALSFALTFAGGGPTPTNTPTATPTPTRTPTNTAGATPTNTPTRTPTNTLAATPTSTATRTPTNTPTATPTRTNTPTATPTSTPTRTPTSTPTQTPGGSPCTCQGDADKNNFVNFTDFGSVQSHFGAPADPVTGAGDADCNGFVNFSDFGAVQGSFGAPCP